MYNIKLMFISGALLMPLPLHPFQFLCPGGLKHLLFLFQFVSGIIETQQQLLLLVCLCRLMMMMHIFNSSQQTLWFTVGQ